MRRGQALFSMVLATTSAGLHGCERRAETYVPTVVTEQGRPPVAEDGLTIGPMTLFERGCARCHGREGGMYAETMAASSEAKRQADIARMLEGPAQMMLAGVATPGARERGALASYHRAIARGDLFAIVTKTGAAGMEGEASPGASVWIEGTGGERLAEAERDGEWGWRWRPAEGRFVTAAQVVIERGGTVIRIKAAAGASSHEKPSE